MLKKYSISRDFLYSLIVVIVMILISTLTSYNILNFNTSDVVKSMFTLSSVLFGFILTIITMLFMFDPTHNPIFKKLQKDGLFNQIFKRFFDSLIVTAVALVIFLIINIYFSSPKNSFILNSIIVFFILSIALRIFRCLYLLEKIYKALTFRTE